MKFPGTCLLFDLHKSSDLVLETHSIIREAASGLFDVVCTMHGAEPLDGIEGETICLSDDEIFRAFWHEKGERLIPGNMDLKIIAAATRLPGYDNFIRYEYDVWPLGDVAGSLEALAEIASTSDLGCSFLEKKPPKSDWVWFASVGGNEADLGDRSLNDVLHGSFLPLSTYSRGFLNAYREYLQRGWVGHEEALTPTLAHLAGMRTTNISAEPHSLTARANFGVTKVEEVAENKGRFVHPVKTAEDRDRLVGARQDSDA